MEEAFLKAAKEHQGILLKVCRMYCSDREDAEDLFQESLLNMWKAWPRFRGDSKLSTWIYRIALNTAITRLRKSKRTIRFNEIEAEHYSLPDDSAVRLDILFDHELQLAIDGLNKLDKALLMLYLDETSYKEIAEILGLSESNVGVKINRIKKTLKAKINP